MLIKDKMEKLESRGKKSNILDPWALFELKLMRGPIRRQSNESKMPEIVNYLPVADLKAQWKKKGKEELHNFYQNSKRNRGQNYFETYYRNGVVQRDKNEP
jgi:hypothetical protein